MLHGYFWQRDLSSKSLVALWTTETYCIFLQTFKLYLLIGWYRYSRTLRGQNSWLKVVILNRKLATRRVFLLATIDFKWTNNKSKHISVVFLVRVSHWNRGPFCKYQYWPTTLAQCQAKGIFCPWDLMLANQHIVCGLNGSGSIQYWHQKKVCKTMLQWGKLLLGQSWFYVLNVPFTQCCFTT